ncbi:MAG: DUF89 family protein [Elusimicrobia bacterium]|nr:DUF89 family protein [Elusimicrobiota bacterium]MBD3411791.1 DUF89 family protein [Elusimicrobiota bacterium]
MKTYPECFPCFMKQAFYAARTGSSDQKLQQKALHEACTVLAHASTDRSPPYTATDVFHTVNRIIANPDPYARAKKEFNELVKKNWDHYLALITQSPDPLRMAVKLSLAGNSIDFGILETVDLDEAIERILGIEPTIDEYVSFRKLITQATSLVFLTDNAGEIGFDRLLIDQIHLTKPSLAITVVVKQVPIINDATVYDAQFFGLDKYRVITNGSRHVGTFLPSCSAEMLRAYNHAEIIVAKGQANFESLEDQHNDRIYFLLKIKCACVARHLGVAVGDTAIKRG